MPAADSQRWRIVGKRLLQRIQRIVEKVPGSPLPTPAFALPHETLLANVFAESHAGQVPIQVH
jgi:hypothetical protein